MNNLSPNDLEEGTWSEWRRLVLNELGRLNNDIDEVKNNLKLLEVKIATESTKLTLYATFGGVCVGALVTYVLNFLMKK